MSLYKFIESFISDNPDITKINIDEQISYNDLYKYYESKQRRYPIQSILDSLFFESLMKCSTNIIEYEYLKSETLKICQISQKIFNIAIEADLLERNKNKNMVNQIMTDIEIKK